MHFTFNTQCLVIELFLRVAPFRANATQKNQKDTYNQPLHYTEKLLIYLKQNKIDLDYHIKQTFNIFKEK